MVEGAPGVDKARFTQGTPRLLNVFASWCIPCIAESPQLMRLKAMRSEEHTSELQSLMRISYAVFCLKKKKNNKPRSTSKWKLNTKKQEYAKTTNTQDQHHM